MRFCLVHVVHVLQIRTGTQRCLRKSKSESLSPFTNSTSTTLLTKTKSKGENGNSDDHHPSWLARMKYRGEQTLGFQYLHTEIDKVKPNFLAHLSTTGSVNVSHEGLNRFPSTDQRKETYQVGKRSVCYKNRCRVRTGSTKPLSGRNQRNFLSYVVSLALENRQRKMTVSGFVAMLTEPVPWRFHTRSHNRSFKLSRSPIHTSPQESLLLPKFTLGILLTQVLTLCHCPQRRRIEAAHLAQRSYALLSLQLPNGIFNGGWHLLRLSHLQA